MLSKAFVNFFKEARGRRVVQVEDIAEFEPKSHGDFDEHKTYMVKWPHLPNEGSFSTESLYEAKILCLGKSMEDLEHEAKAIGLKLPKVSPVPIEPKSSDVKKSKRGRTIVKTKPQDAVPSSGPDPYMKKKRKTTSEDRARESRHLKSLDKYEPLFAPDSPKTDQENFHSRTKQSKKDSLIGAKSPSKKQAVVIESPSPRMKVTDNWPGKKLIEDLISPETLGGISSPVKSVTLGSSSLNRILQVGNTNFSVKKLGSASHSDLQCFSKPMFEKSVPSSKSFDSPLTPRETLPDATNLSEGDADAEDKLSLHEVISMGDSNGGGPFMRPQTPTKVVSNAPSATENLCPDSKGRFQLRKRSSKDKTYDSDDSNTSATSYMTSDAEKDLFYQKILSLEASTKRFQVENRKLHEDLSNSKQEIDKLNEKLAKYMDVNMKLTEKLLQQHSVLSNEENETTGMEAASSPGVVSLASPSHSSPEKKQLKRKLSFDETDGVASTGSRSKKRKSVDPREDNVTSSSELADMIIDALKGKTPLQNDGAGKVHIGNGVWIAQDLWEDKLRKSTVSPNIALRDTMEKCYSREEMAERSLDGGTPVKCSSDGKKIKKKKMTPKKREALLGLHRAKQAVVTGSSDKHFLDLSAKGAKDTIRYKLKEVAKSFKNKSPKP